MNKIYKLLTLVFIAIILAAFTAGASGAAQSSILSYPEGYEELGYELGAVIHNNVAPGDIPVIAESLPDSADVLLIPESTDDCIDMFDPYSGDYLGCFIPSFEQFSTPVCAMAGPDDNIYISDQVSDAVFIFDREGNYLDTYANSDDGLNNIRGIDFRDGHLFVTSGDEYVAEFDGPHNRLEDFINDGSDPFDIMFLEDGRSLLCDIQGTSDNVRMYNTNGELDHEIFSVNFPEQVQFDLANEGQFLNAGFSENVITGFNLDETIFQFTWDSGRGVYRLGNGNILATNGDYVAELDPETGNIIEVKAEGSYRFIELIPALYQTDVNEPNSNIPTSYALLENYPNPFNASTLIKYELPEASNVTIEIFDILGCKVSTLRDAIQPAGQYQVVWNADNVSSGVYLYKITTDNFSDTKKMMLVK